VGLKGLSLSFMVRVERFGVRLLQGQVSAEGFV
jgi:hypothetical protein